MKTAVSIPDRLFERAEALARRLGVSRGQLCDVGTRVYWSSVNRTLVAVR